MLKHWVERCKKFSKCVCSENKISNSNKNIFSQTTKNKNIDNFETGSYTNYLQNGNVIEINIKKQQIYTIRRLNA